jgi:CubicO group peptidase (beta-lactamase class C family)
MKAVVHRTALLAAFACFVAAPQARSADSLDDYLEGVRTEYDLPALAAAVTKGGEVVAAGAVGVRAIGVDSRVTVNDRFHIGSDTKAMTATIAGALKEKGLIDWNTTVGDVLASRITDMNPALAAVTLEQLLSHSSGIPTDTADMVDIYVNSLELEMNPDDMRLDAIERWKHNVPKVPDASPFQYANFGYMIAGAMLETVAGEPWEHLIHTYIFEPLGMQTAGLGPQASVGRYDAAIGHMVDADGTVTPMFWGPAADVPPLLGPAGSAHMSVLDFAKWADWNAGGGKRGPAIVTPETLADIHRARVRTPPRPNPPPGTPAEGDYALGWGLVAFEWADEPLLSHNGSNSMNIAKILVDPDLDFSVVVMTNFPGPGADAAAAEVERHLYETFSGKP